MTRPSLLSDEQLRFVAAGRCAKPVASWSLAFCVRLPRHPHECMAASVDCCWCDRKVMPDGQGSQAPEPFNRVLVHRKCAQEMGRELVGDYDIEQERGAA